MARQNNLAHGLEKAFCLRDGQVGIAKSVPRNATFLMNVLNENTKQQIRARCIRIINSEKTRYYIPLLREEKDDAEALKIIHRFRASIQYDLLPAKKRTMTLKEFIARKVEE